MRTVLLEFPTEWHHISQSSLAVASGGRAGTSWFKILPVLPGTGRPGATKAKCVKHAACLPHSRAPHFAECLGRRLGRSGGVVMVQNFARPSSGGQAGSDENLVCEIVSGISHHRALHFAEFLSCCLGWSGRTSWCKILPVLPGTGRPGATKTRCVKKRFWNLPSPGTTFRRIPRRSPRAAGRGRHGSKFCPSFLGRAGRE